MSEITKYNPFEQAFMDYLNGDTQASVIVHNNKGDDEHMKIDYFFRKYNAMPEMERKALKACKGKVLDVGAGSGCHSFYLQQTGFDVTALDIQKGFVEVMKRRGIEKVVEADIRDYTKEKFDTVLMLMDGIGFTETLAGLSDFLQKAKELLLPGGQILLDSADLLYLYEDDDGTYKIDLNEGYYGEVQYQVEYNGKLGKPFPWLFVDYSNLSFLAGQAGFQCEMLFEDEHFNYLARLY